MNYGKEFKDFATKDQGISSTYFDQIVSSMYPVGLTPNIIEERQMNIAIFDVFSRLMMDRIIFMGMGINDQVANIVRPVAVFGKRGCLKGHTDIHQLSGEACMLVWGFTIPCNSSNQM